MNELNIKIRYEQPEYKYLTTEDTVSEIVDNVTTSIDMLVDDNFIKSNYIIELINEWIDVTKQLPPINDNIQLLIKTNNKMFHSEFNYELARYTEWGFHYGSRNTQDIIPIQNIIEWRFIN